MKERNEKPVNEALSENPIMAIREVTGSLDELEEHEMINDPNFMENLRIAAKDIADGKSKDWSDMLQ